MPPPNPIQPAPAHLCPSLLRRPQQLFLCRSSSRFHWLSTAPHTRWVSLLRMPTWHCSPRRRLHSTGGMASGSTGGRSAQRVTGSPDSPHQVPDGRHRPAASSAPEAAAAPSSHAASVSVVAVVVAVLIPARHTEAASSSKVTHCISRPRCCYCAPCAKQGHRLAVCAGWQSTPSPPPKWAMPGQATCSGPGTHQKRQRGSASLSLSFL